jgi:hypothetical protein
VPCQSTVDANIKLVQWIRPRRSIVANHLSCTAAINEGRMCR